MKQTPPTCANCKQSFLSLGLLESECIWFNRDVHCSEACVLQYQRATWYRDFLLQRIFSSISYKSNDAFLAAIKEARQLDQTGNWRETKKAFNDIGLRCQFRDLAHSGYGFTLSDLPRFLECETMAYKEAVGAIKT